jgi:hypothetical protein
MMHQELKKIRTYGPNVRLIERDRQAVVEKTYKDKALPVRLLGCILIFWEKFIYSKLCGIDGIPDLVPGTDRFTLLTRFMGGTNLKDSPIAPEGPYFESLKSLIAVMHSRGVIHLDLRNRRNYGIDDVGKPYLVDFATCLYIPWNGKARRLFEAIDWMGFMKVKAKIRPDLLNEQEGKLSALGAALSSLWLPTKIVRLLRACAKIIKRKFG